MLLSKNSVHNPDTHNGTDAVMFRVAFAGWG
jgi:hypothetical protein